MGNTIFPGRNRKPIYSHNLTFLDQKIAVGHCQGGRRTDEDETLVSGVTLPDGRQALLIAIFDGHCGDQAATEGAKLFRKTFLSCLSLSDSQSLDLCQVLKKTISEVDQMLGKMKIYQSGTTCTCAVLVDQKVVIGNLGDSRTAVYEKDGTLVFATVDHKPTTPSEKQRIEEAGGKVEEGRVNGNLAVSRALGDFTFKSRLSDSDAELKSTDWRGDLISSEADVTEIDFDQNKILVLACDGIWDVLSHDELGQFFLEQQKKFPSMDHPTDRPMDRMDPIPSTDQDPPDADSLEEIIVRCFDKWQEIKSSDNVSIVVIASKDSPVGKASGGAKELSTCFYCSGNRSSKWEESASLDSDKDSVILSPYNL